MRGEQVPHVFDYTLASRETIAKICNWAYQLQIEVVPRIVARGTVAWLMGHCEQVAKSGSELTQCWLITKFWRNFREPGAQLVNVHRTDSIKRQGTLSNFCCTTIHT